MCLGLEENGNGLEEPNEKAKNKRVMNWRHRHTQLKSFSDSSIEVREHKFGVNPVLEDKSYLNLKGSLVMKSIKNTLPNWKLKRRLGKTNVITRIVIWSRHQG